MPLELRIVLIVATCLGAGAAIGWLAGRRFGGWAAGLSGTAGALLWVWLILSARAAPGMEGLGLLVLAVIFVLPGTVGLVAAAWLGARRKRAAEQRCDRPPDADPARRDAPD